MGWLRKKAKQIGKGIKKLVKNVGRAIGKLGIVGQIGMMMFMPTIAGSLWGSLGSFAAKGTSLIHKAAGAIFNAGNAIGSAYSTVTEAIGNGLNRATNFLKGEGFVLSPDKTSIFGKPTDVTDVTKVTDTVTEKIVEDKVEEKTSETLLGKTTEYVQEGFERLQ